MNYYSAPNSRTNFSSAKNIDNSNKVHTSQQDGGFHFKDKVLPFKRTAKAKKIEAET